MECGGGPFFVAPSAIHSSVNQWSHLFGWISAGTDGEDGPGDTSSIFNLSGPSDTEDSFMAHEVGGWWVGEHHVLDGLHI